MRPWFLFPIGVKPGINAVHCEFVADWIVPFDVYRNKMKIEMNSKKKIVIGVCLAVVVGFSSYSFYTSPMVTGPVWKKNPDAYDSLTMANSTETVNLSQNGQNTTFAFYVSTKETQWSRGQGFYLSVSMGKISQSLSSPYTAVSAVITHISVHAGNSNAQVRGGGRGDQITQVGNSSFITDYFLVTPAHSYSSPDVSVTIHVESVLFIGIYHFPGNQKSVTENFTIG